MSVGAVAMSSSTVIVAALTSQPLPAQGCSRISSGVYYLPTFCDIGYLILRKSACAVHHLVTAGPARRTIQAPSQESFPENGGAVAFNGTSPMFLALRWKRFSR